MSPTRAPRWLVPGLVAVVAAACGDQALPTTPPPLMNGSPAAPTVNRALIGSTPVYACYMSTLDGAPHQSRLRRMSLRLAAEARPSTSVPPLHYQVQARRGDGTTEWVAHCVIPRTAAAVRIMNQRFGAPANAGLPDGDVRITGDFYLEAIVIESCANPDWQKDDSGTCWPPDPEMGGADGGDPWGGGDDDLGGSGSSGGGIQPPDDSEQDAFEEGPLLWGVCILAVAGSVVAVATVADHFSAWHKTAGDLSAVDRMLLIDDLEHAVRFALQLERDRLQERYDDHVRQIHQMTGASVLSLMGAAIVCSPSLILPTP